MRKLVLLVCMIGIATLLTVSENQAGVIPSWEAPSGKIGFYPIVNEFSLYQNYDDSGTDRGRTFQVISINSFKLLTSFTFEFTGDFNYDFTPGLANDHYIELSIVKPITTALSFNVQRIISTFEPEPVNQFGIRLSL